MVDFLMQLGHEVICMDNFFCGDKVNNIPTTLHNYRESIVLNRRRRLTSLDGYPTQGSSSSGTTSPKR